MPLPRNYKVIFFAVSLIGSLALALPALSLILPERTKERFSEIYILGPNRIAEEYPFNIKSNETYTIILGIGNHMGSSAYYAVYVKIRNSSERLPAVSKNEPSPLPTVYEYRTFIVNEGVVEKPINFSFNFQLSSEGKYCILKSLTINGVVFNLNKTIQWDPERKGFLINMLFELWIYNLKIGGFSFHNRFVGIWLNMTVSM